MYLAKLILSGKSPRNIVNTCERFSTYAFEYNRSSGNPVNPFLMMINAGINFKRYLQFLNQVQLTLWIHTQDYTVSESDLLEFGYSPKAERRARLTKAIDDANVPRSAVTGTTEIDIGDDGKDDDPTLQPRVLSGRGKSNIIIPFVIVFLY